MTIEQTIEIPVSRQLTIEIPEIVPTGKTRMVIQFPLYEDAQTSDIKSVDQKSGSEIYDAEIPPEAKGQISNEAFRRGLRRAYGAWKDNPWTNHIEDINAMRDEWDHRDPWNPDPTKRHRD